MLSAGHLLLKSGKLNLLGGAYILIIPVTPISEKPFEVFNKIKSKFFYTCRHTN